MGISSRKNYVSPNEKSRKNHHAPAVLDPISLANDGETALRSRLNQLSIEQLRILCRIMEWSRQACDEVERARAYN
jgi:hypothetical protein